MNFSVDMNTQAETFVKLNGESCLLWIMPKGLLLNDTSFPQKDVEYIPCTNRLQIIGVDMV